jgi:poly-gamma-glutamate synthesis protein (capsule biosynthesis protein)
MLTRRALWALPAVPWLPLRRDQAGPAVPKLRYTRLVCGGDVMLSRAVGAWLKADPAAALRGVAPLFRSADLAFVNLESPFSDRGPIWRTELVFHAEPATIQTLVDAGIDIVSTANNHARDCGARGVEFTLDWLARHGIAATGSARSAEELRQGVTLERNGLRFGFLAYTYDQTNGNHPKLDDRIALIDVGRMQQEVAGLCRRADSVIVSMHHGFEYWTKPSDAQVEFSRAAIDAGARLVIGHHPHVVQPAEVYRDGLILYSLGNLVFDQRRPDTQQGLVAEVVFLNEAVVRYRLLPVDLPRFAPEFSRVRPAVERRLRG